MKEEFKDIAPYDDSDFSATMARLVKEPGFENAIKYVMPDADYRQVANSLLQIDNKEDFQKKVMFGILKILESKTTAGASLFWAPCSRLTAGSPEISSASHPRPTASDYPESGAKWRIF